MNEHSASLNADINGSYQTKRADALPYMKITIHLDFVQSLLSPLQSCNKNFDLLFYFVNTVYCTLYSLISKISE